MNTYEQLIENLKNVQRTWLVTGNAGFIGSNLMEFFLSHNQKVIGFDNFSTGYKKNIDDVLSYVGPDNAKNFTFIEGNTWDFNSCLKACQGVDIVLHHAALGSVPRSIKDPVLSNQSNITGFLNMLTAARDTGIKRFVYASSSSVYGDSKELPKVENKTGNVLSPYAAMKMANELYAGVFKRNYSMETIGLRYFNVFGKRQDPLGAYAAVIPKWVDSLTNGKDIHINGDGETSRDFTYIDNVIQMNLLAGLTNNVQTFGEVFNVAVGGRNTLNELFSIINREVCKYTDIASEAKPIYCDFRVGDIRHSNADISKAKTNFSYYPKINIEDGLSRYVNWYINSHKTKTND